MTKSLRATVRNDCSAANNNVQHKEGHEWGGGRGQPKGHAVKRNRSTAANRATTLAKAKAEAKAKTLPNRN